MAEICVFELVTKKERFLLGSTMADFRITEGLTNIRRRFVEELQPRRDELVLLRDKISDLPLGEENLTSIARIAHKIAGTAPTLGFSKLGISAAELDKFIFQNLDMGAISKSTLFRLMDNMITLCDQILCPEHY